MQRLYQIILCLHRPRNGFVEERTATYNRIDALRRMQFFADNPAQCGFNLLSRHGLVERLIDERLVSTLTGFGLEECND